MPWSLVAKPAYSGVDGARTDGSTDGAYAESGPSKFGIPDGVWTDSGDGWTPVYLPEDPAGRGARTSLSARGALTTPSSRGAAARTEGGWSLVFKPETDTPVRGAFTTTGSRGASTTPTSRGALTGIGDGWTLVTVSD